MIGEVIGALVLAAVCGPVAWLAFNLVVDELKDPYRDLAVMLFSGAVGLIFGSIAVVALMFSITTPFMESICTKEAKIAGIEDSGGTRSTIHYLYKLDNGQRWDDTEIRQNGETVCIESDTVWKGSR